MAVEVGGCLYSANAGGAVAPPLEAPCVGRGPALALGVHARRQTLEAALAAYSSLFCVRCLTYGCLVHTGPHARQQKRPPSLRAAAANAGPLHDNHSTGESGCSNTGAALAAGGGRVSRAARAAAWTAPAGAHRTAAAPDAQFLLAGQRNAAERQPPWTELEAGLLARGLGDFGPDACRIARLVGTRSCADVRARLLAGDVSEHAGNVSKQGDLQAAGSEGAGVPAAVPAAPAPAARGPENRRKPREAPRRKHAAAKQVIATRLRHDRTLAWPAYSPGCRKKTCPCVAAGMECDPDLCKGCAPAVGVVHAPAADADESAPACCNMRLRQRQHKRVAMGLSDIAGWGAFLLENAARNDLIGEYTGELVSQEEAERRGRAYDSEGFSYLFNLDRDWVLDARFRGNKLRFINHSTEANCRAEVVLVQGDHRVAILAVHDIPAGQELMLDYRYDRARAPAWHNP
ncbi:hypothetical protein WJX81_006349 [Elliptochloris bilobata]|uniref:SET domain-containing protein n=1 Tax=Elliptochloris bilobata TaxID=381761 RepID=A0AAW1SLD0_9CHLO